MPETLSIGFNVPFDEAIAAMDAREIVLPAKYYGELQGIQRQLAFSIAGVASLDQLQAVLDSLTNVLLNGQTFKQWQDSIAVQDLGLPKHRLDNIYRTNIQNAYNRGHWEQFKQNEAYQPYLMYDAINDSRTRPSHRALDGIIRRIDDPFWDTHYPANGYRCRCSVVSLSESQAQARSKGDNGLNKKIDLNNVKPDKGWDYNCGSDITAGINKAIADRLAKAAAKTVEPKLAKLLKKKVTVPKDDPLHVDKIVAKTPADAPPPKKPKTKKTEISENPPTISFKKASETPQTAPTAAKWTREYIDELQKKFPYKFENGVFNPDLVKVGSKIKNAKTGETWQWDDVKKEIVDGSYKKPKASLQKPSKASNVAQSDPIAATWDDESLALMKERFPQHFDKNGNFVNPSKTKPTPSNEKVKEVLKKADATPSPAKAKITKQKADDKEKSRRRFEVAEQEEVISRIYSKFGLKGYFNNTKYKEGLKKYEKMNLTLAEYQAIYAYTGDGFRQLNGYLGGWIKDTTVPSNVLDDFRDLLRQALDKLPPNDTKVVHRGIAISEKNLKAHLAKYEIGEEINDLFFASTSKYAGSSFGGNVRYEIIQKSGVDISSLSKYSSENEVLMKNDTKYKVISKELVSGKWVIKLEEI